MPRELHDVGSHGLGLITVRAAAARTVAGPDAERERAAALADIERAGREATTELRRLLGVLRDPDDEAPLRPPPSLSDLATLATASRRAGIGVDLHVPAAVAVSPGVLAAVHAVVGEALANVARHAGPGARARVAVRRESHDVIATVEDAGPVRE
nr:histidine kinase [Mobilicoccus massiliensis]